MSTRRERGATVSPEPADNLSAQESIRLQRFKAVYSVGVTFQIECEREAAQLLDRLDFTQWLILTGRLNDE